jgi:hypothetical protein
VNVETFVINLMRRYNQRMFRIARSIVIDDSAALGAVQEANIKTFFASLNIAEIPAVRPGWRVSRAMKR